MSENTDKCPKCGAEMEYDKVSDVSVLAGSLWVNLHIHACPEQSADTLTIMIRGANDDSPRTRILRAGVGI